MTIGRYRLTKLGWLGAALFVLPTPIAAWEYSSEISRFAARTDFDRRLEGISGAVAAPQLSMFLFTVLATASLIGFVMLLVGREIEAD